jgi:hypothetical protein
MIKYVTDILKTLSPAQRIMGLFMLLLTITLISLGPSIIDASTTNCEEANIRLNNQDSMITKLNKRVNELSNELVDNQIEYTNKLVKKQTETMLYVDSMIKELEFVNTIHKRENQMVKKDEGPSFGGDSVMRDIVIVPKIVKNEKTSNDIFVDKLKSLRQKLKKDIKNSN